MIEQNVVKKESNKSGNDRRKKSKVWSLIFVVALVVFLYCAYQIGLYIWGNYATQKEYTEVETDFVQIKPEESVAPNEPKPGQKAKEVKKPTKLQVDFDKLTVVNQDIVAWIYFPNAKISYPIMYTTDNNYYLTHTYKKTVMRAGSIFIDYQNIGDFSEKNTIIYGHNMKDGSMFGKLKNYNEKSFADNNQCFYILTKDKIYRCDVFSTYLTPADSKTYTYQFGSKKSYTEYLEMVKKQAKFPSDEQVTEQDNIVTLSTCTGISHDYRQVVHGKLVDVTK